MGGLFNRLAVQTALFVIFVIFVIAIVGVVIAVQVGGAVGKNEEENYRDRIRRGITQLQERTSSFANLTKTGAIVLARIPNLREAVVKRDVVASLTAATGFSEIIGAPSQGTTGMQLYDASGNPSPRRTRHSTTASSSPLRKSRSSCGPRSPFGGVWHDELLGLVLTGTAIITRPDGSTAGAIEVVPPSIPRSPWTARRHWDCGWRSSTRPG